MSAANPVARITLDISNRIFLVTVTRGNVSRSYQHLPWLSSDHKARRMSRAIQLITLAHNQRRAAKITNHETRPRIEIDL